MCPKVSIVTKFLFGFQFLLTYLWGDLSNTFCVLHFAVWLTLLTCSARVITSKQDHSWQELPKLQISDVTYFFIFIFPFLFFWGAGNQSCGGASCWPSSSPHPADPFVASLSPSPSPLPLLVSEAALMTRASDGTVGQFPFINVLQLFLPKLILYFLMWLSVGSWE